MRAGSSSHSLGVADNGAAVPEPCHASRPKKLAGVQARSPDCCAATISKNRRPVTIFVILVDRRKMPQIAGHEIVRSGRLGALQHTIIGFVG